MEGSGMLVRCLWADEFPKIVYNFYLVSSYFDYFIAIRLIAEEVQMLELQIRIVFKIAHDYEFYRKM